MFFRLPTIYFSIIFAPYEFCSAFNGRTHLILIHVHDLTRLGEHDEVHAGRELYSLGYGQSPND